MSGGLSPRFSFSRRFHGIAYVFAIPQRGFAEQPAIRAAHFHVFPGLPPLLLPADKEFHRAVDRWPRCVLLLRWLLHRQRFWLEARRFPQPYRLPIFQI